MDTEHRRAGSEEWGSNADDSSTAGDGRSQQQQQQRTNQRAAEPSRGFQGNNNGNRSNYNKNPGESHPQQQQQQPYRQSPYHATDRKVFGQQQQNAAAPVQQQQQMPQTANLKTVILKLASSTSLDENLAENLGKFTSPLADEIKMKRDEVATLFADLVMEYTEMLGSLSTMVMLLNKVDYIFGRSFTELIGLRLQTALREGQFERAEKCLVAISSLTTHLISASSTLSLFEQLVEVHLQPPSVPQRIADWYVFIVMAALPYSAPVFVAKKRERELQRLMDSIEDYMTTKRPQAAAALTAVRVFRSDASSVSSSVDSNVLPQEDALNVLWDQIRDLKLRGWINTILMRPYDKFEQTLQDSMKQQLPTIQIPSVASTGSGSVVSNPSAYPMPAAVFRVFDENDVPDSTVMPRANSIERFLVEQNLRRMIRRYHTKAEYCARALLDYPEVVTTLPLDYIILEVVIGEMLRLPTPDYPLLCYYSILFRLCDQRKDLFPESLAFTIDLIFQRLEHMNSLAFERFVNWFAWHLSQCNLKWRWSDWATKVLNTGCSISASGDTAVEEEGLMPVDLSLSKKQPAVVAETDARARFISQVFAKSIRFMFYELLVEEVKQSANVIEEDDEEDDDDADAQAVEENVKKRRSEVVNGGAGGGGDVDMQQATTDSDAVAAPAPVIKKKKQPADSQQQQNLPWQRLKQLLPTKPVPVNVYASVFVDAANLVDDNDDDGNIDDMNEAGENAAVIEPKYKRYASVVQMMSEKKEVQEVFNFVRRIKETGRLARVARSAAADATGDAEEEAIITVSSLTSTSGVEGDHQQLLHVAAAAAKQRAAVKPSQQIDDDDADEPLPAVNKLQVDILLSALFSLSQHTFTHLSRGIQKYTPALKFLASIDAASAAVAGMTGGGSMSMMMEGATAGGGGGGGEEAGWWLLDCVGAYWSRKPQTLAFVVDRMLRCSILEAKQVVQWLFAEHMRRELMLVQNLQPWELIDNVIVWQMRHIEQLEKDVQTARARLQRMDEDAAAPPSNRIEYSNPDDAPPTEEQIERMDERLSESQNQQRELFMLIFQRLIMTINLCQQQQSNLSSRGGGGAANSVYSWLLGRLQALLFKHKTLIVKDLQNLDQLLFNRDVLEQEVYQVWEQFKLLI